MQWWRIQNLVHPLFIGLSIYLSNSTGNELYGLIGIPFVFNWGAEPFAAEDYCEGTWLVSSIYLHHFGPILACLNPFVIEGCPKFALANALVFGHIWSQHTLDALGKRNVIDQKRFFWPFVLLEFVTQAYWFRTVVQELGDQDLALTTCCLLLVPMVCQYAGRWTLYQTVRKIMGWPKEESQFYCAFNTRKQFWEITFLLSNSVLFAGGNVQFTILLVLFVLAVLAFWMVAIDRQLRFVM